MTSREQEIEKAKRGNERATTGSSSTSSTRVRARAREELRELVEDYARYVDQPDRYVIRMMAEALEDMEADVIRSAIRDTGKAKRPSKRYLEFILDRYVAEGISTIEDVIKDKDAFQLRMQSAKRRRYAKWYDDESELTSFDRAVEDPLGFYDYGFDEYLPSYDDKALEQRKRDLVGDDR